MNIYSDIYVFCLVKMQLLVTNVTRLLRAFFLLKHCQQSVLCVFSHSAHDEKIPVFNMKLNLGDG